MVNTLPFVTLKITAQLSFSQWTMSLNCSRGHGEIHGWDTFQQGMAKLLSLKLQSSYFIRIRKVCQGIWFTSKIYHRFLLISSLQKAKKGAWHTQVNTVYMSVCMWACMYYSIISQNFLMLWLFLKKCVCESVLIVTV